MPRTRSVIRLIDTYLKEMQTLNSVDTFVARQPIFDRSERVHAYELLYRSSATTNEFSGADSDTASLRVLARTILSIGVDQLLCGKKAFINFGRNLLVDELTTFLPAEIGVIEVLETVEPDADVVRSCKKLREMGYTIALDDFVWDPKFEPLLELAHIVKVDMRTTSREEQERLCRTCTARGIAMLAEKVETREEFEWAQKAGYEYFQGYFFARPAVMTAREIPAATVTCLQLLNELLHPGLDFNALETAIRKDISLVHKLFSYVNSAQFGRTASIDSIRRALVQLGEDGIRRWVILATLQETAKNRPVEIVTCGLVRARFCETIARLSGEPNPLVYLIGLFSILDGLLDCPLEEALRRIGLTGSLVGDVLLGVAPERGMPARVYQAVQAYEAAQWDSVEAIARELKVPVADFCGAYIEATGWAANELKSATAQTSSEQPQPRNFPDRSKKRERRAHERTPVNVSLTILWGSAPGQENVARARLLDVSAKGARLRLPTPIPRGAWLAFNNQALGIGGRGTVRYCTLTKGQYDVGVDVSNGTGWGTATKDRSTDLRRLGAAIQRLQPVGVSGKSEVRTAS